MITTTTWLLTFACGHREPRELAYLPPPARAAAARTLARGICSHCLRIKRQRRRDAWHALQQQKQREAERWSDATHLPRLVGTPRQVAWAVRVRRRLIVTAGQREPDAVERARAITAASWWIDHRTVAPETLCRLLRRIHAHPGAVGGIT